MGKSTISMGHGFNSKLLVITRGYLKYLMLVSPSVVFFLSRPSIFFLSHLRHGLAFGFYADPEVLPVGING